MMKKSSSFGRVSSSSRHSISNYSRRLDLPSDHEDDDGSVGRVAPSPMLPLFLNDLVHHHHNHNHNQLHEQEFVEVTLELDDDSIFVRSVAPADETNSISITNRIRNKFPWLRSSTSSRASTSSSIDRIEDTMPTMSARDARRMNAKLQRTRSSAQAALRGLRFISKATGASDAKHLWTKVESRFLSLAKDGLLPREDFADCIGMVDSKEFALRIFDALARRKGLRISKINKEELHEFWMKISDQSFDARLQIFFDMADSNEDGRITRDEVQELILLSASANNLAKLKERTEEYSSLIMEELDPENLGYIELWQLETLLLQRDTYMNYSRPLSTTSVGWSQNLTSLNPTTLFRKATTTFSCLLLENWQRCWILSLWILAMAGLFCWKFFQYKNRDAFQVMGYCLPTAKGAAETLKLNMALILLPVCRNTLTWLRSTTARSFVPFDDNINFHKIIACFIAIGIVVHGGIHLSCDFPRLINSSAEKFALIASDFHNQEKPTYKDLLTGIEGVTGIAMVVLMVISFTLATHGFRRNIVRLPSPFNRLTGFNAFWYSHHLFGLVYLLLFIHGTFLFFVHKWTQKTTWVYISIPLLLYLAERSLRACRSEYYSVEILKVSVLPGNVFSLTMLKPRGFKYRSGQYIFLQCPKISQFEWHPFSITSAPGDDYLSVHIRTVGDWTRELKQVFTEHVNSKPVLVRAKLGQLVNMERKSQPRLLVDGPYGAPAQDYQNYDVLLLVGLGIGATPFISILKDLLNNTRMTEDQTDSITETSRSEDSSNSFASSNTTPGGKKKLQRTTAHAHFYWVTREPGSFEWFKGVMDEVAEIDNKGQIELHNYLTSVYEENDARTTLITMVQALNHAKHGVDILSGTRARTHFARPNWKEVFTKIASKHPYKTVGVFYCGMPMLAKELKNLSLELSRKTSTRFEFHKEYF